MSKITVEAITQIQAVLECARITQGLDADGELSPAKFARWLKAGESQCHIYLIKIRIEELPYWVAMHLRTHKVGPEWFPGDWFVRSQRPDVLKPVGYDRRKEPQDALVNSIVVASPQALINISHKRLCSAASPETREVWQAVKDAMSASDNPYIAVVAPLMVPDCEYLRECPRGARSCKRSKS